jgi:hypothetical protein
MARQVMRKSRECELKDLEPRGFYGRLPEESTIFLTFSLRSRGFVLKRKSFLKKERGRVFLKEKNGTAEAAPPGKLDGADAVKAVADRSGHTCWGRSET